MATEMEFLGNLSFLSRSIDQRKERIDTQLILVLRLLTFAWFRVGCSDFFAFSNVNLVLLVFHWCRRCRLLSECESSEFCVVVEIDDDEVGSIVSSKYWLWCRFASFVGTHCQHYCTQRYGTTETSRKGSSSAWHVSSLDGARKDSLSHAPESAVLGENWCLSPGRFGGTLTWIYQIINST